MRSAVGPRLSCVVVLGFVLILLAPLPSGAAAADAPRIQATPSHASRRESPVAPPRNGRLHPLGAPALLGRWVLGAHARRSLQLSGHGIPSSGVRAVALTLVGRASRPTTVSLSRSSTAPAFEQLDLRSGTASSFAIVPLGGSPTAFLRSGAHAVTVTVFVTGWFATATEPGTAGFLRAAHGPPVLAGTVAGGKHRSVVVAGRGDIPAAGASAALVRVTATSAASGTIGLGPTARSDASTVSLAFPAGTSTDLALVRLSGGRLDVHDLGGRSTRVTLSVVAWFTAGSGPSQFGDTLSISSHPVVVVRQTVGTSGAPVVGAGRAGVPPASSSAPADLVLWHAVASSPRSLGVQVDGDGLVRTGPSALSVHASQPRAATVLAPLGPDGVTSVRTTAATASLRAEAFAWFAGATVVADGAHVLDPASLAQITSLDDSSIHFAPEPASLSDLAVGDTVVAGLSPTTPDGLLRRVTAVDRTGGALTLTTVTGSLADVIEQGALSTDSPAVMSAPGAGRAPRDAGVDCGAGVAGNPFGGGSEATVSCSVSLSGDGWSGRVDTDFTVSSLVQVTFPIGLVPRVHADTTTAVSATLTVDGQVSASLSLSKDFQLASLPPIEFLIGYVPVTIHPKLDLSVDLTGELPVDTTATAFASVGLRTVCDSAASGCSVTPALQHSFSGRHGGVDSGQVSLSVGPELAALVYDVAGLAAGGGVGVQAEINRCQIAFTGRWFWHYGLKVHVFSDHLAAELGTDVALVSFPIGHKNLRNCAWWSGSFSFTSHLDHTDGDVNGSTRHRVHGSTTMTIDGLQNGDVPPYGNYTMTGAGSGLDLTEITSDWCGTGTLLTSSTKYDWTSPIEGLGGGHYPIVISRGGGAGDWTVDGMATNGQAQAAATQELRYYANNDCELVTATSDTGFSGNDIFSLFSDGDDIDHLGELRFHLKPDQTVVAGDVSFEQNGSRPGYTLHYLLTKHCLTPGSTTCEEDVPPVNVPARG